MENQNNSQYNLPTDSVYALPQRQWQYGVASGAEAVEVLPVQTTPSSLVGLLSFYFAEYFKGIMFVVLTSVFIIAVPRLLADRKALQIAMYDTFKRGMDIFGAFFGLVITLPIWLVIPILIKLDSRGPVFYTQARVGINTRKQSRRVFNRADVDSNRRQRDRRRADYGGRLFQVFKFRTMVQDAEKATGAVWATKNDPRITRLGRFMRKTRIDEIPQFINILLGDMSLVGPRPERPEFVEKLSREIPGYADRLKVKPGLTGLAQVENGYDSSIDSVARKVDYDREYIRRKSFLTDVRIMLKTVVVVLTGKGAH